MDVADAALNIG